MLICETATVLTAPRHIIDLATLRIRLSEKAHGVAHGKLAVR